MKSHPGFHHHLVWFCSLSVMICLELILVIWLYTSHSYWLWKPLSLSHCPVLYCLPTKSQPFKIFGLWRMIYLFLWQFWHWSWCSISKQSLLFLDFHGLFWKRPDNCLCSGRRNNWLSKKQLMKQMDFLSFDMKYLLLMMGMVTGMMRWCCEWWDNDDNNDDSDCEDDDDDNNDDDFMMIVMTTGWYDVGGGDVVMSMVWWFCGSLDWLSIKIIIGQLLCSVLYTFRRQSISAILVWFFQLFQGNSNTYIAELRDVSPPIIARRIRVIPYSTHPKHVCLRIELYGCIWTGLCAFSLSCCFVTTFHSCNAFSISYIIAFVSLL